MSENNLLPPPILPQAQNGVLDKSKLHGEKIKVKVSTSPPLNLSDGDSITVAFTDDNNESISSTKQLQGAIDPFIEFDFSSDMLPKKYKVGYTVDDVIGNNPIYSPLVNISVIDGTSITPPVKPPADKEPFIVMGARYADLAVANGLKAPQRLTAWTKEGAPHPVIWSYIGGTSPFTSPFSYNNSSFFYDTAPWLPISVSDGTNTLTINPINVFGNGGTLGLPAGAFNDPMETQYSSAFAVLLNDNTMVGWGGSFGNSYTQSGIKTITTNGPAYAGLSVNSTLWTSGSPAPIGSFDDVGAGGNSFFAISKANAQIVAWGDINGTYPSLGNGKNIFVGNSFACTIYNSGTLQSWWGKSGAGWNLEPPSSYVPYPRNLTSMPRGFATIDESGNLSTWGDPDMFSGFNPPYQDFIQAAGIGLRQPDPTNSGEGQEGNIAVHRTGKAYAWSGILENNTPVNDWTQATDLSTTGEKILILQDNKPYVRGFNPITSREFLNLTDIVQIATAANGTAALRQNGTVVTWINNGRNNEFAIYPSISQPDMKNVRAIYGTGTAFLALTADNKVYTWGSSDGGGDSSEVQALFDGKLTYYMD
ncbi:hypothetical protein PSI23_07355 [Xenorhabdus sp. XENO-10]|uniref:Uncharacterized protein n=1 Tax=Xenorhabdus yunnanensis TaxID=3025878 RepID=A0ABT5LDH1_9GAMM|nr:hypothetical protein [Xenorhabdus yunnanensis]MDC9589142.1 hypothetical protein [Xenorhabdus yunnanensis]